MNLEYTIRYEEENTNLDFKAEEYHKKNYESLIKDVMSMANSISNNEKIIVIGVKNTPGQENKIIGLDNITDQATYEELIHTNIEPIINFTYTSMSIDNKLLGIIRIFDNNDRPYMMKKDFGNLKIGDTYIRRGSRQSKMTRNDLNQIISSQSKEILLNKVKLGCDIKLSNSIKIKTIKSENLLFPSQKEKERLEKLLAELEKQKDYQTQIDNLPNQGFNNLIKKTYNLNELFGNAKFIENGEKIKIGTNSFGSAIYENKEGLINRINKVQEICWGEDQYYYYEQNSEKLNFYIYNDSNQFLEDVEISFKFDSAIFDISEEIIDEPIYDPISSIHSKMKSDTCYPNVEKTEDFIIVKEYHNNIRHKNVIKIFYEDIRAVIINLSQANTTKVEYTISAKNLPTLIKGTLEIELY